MSSGYYRVDWWLPYLQVQKEGILVFFYGDEMPTDLEVREQLVLESCIKPTELFFVKIRSVKPCEEPKHE